MFEIPKKYPYYTRTIIPRSYYPGLVNNSSIDGIGVKATMVVSSELDDRTAYIITKEMFRNLVLFKKAHPISENWVKSSTVISASVLRHAITSAP